MTSLVLRENVDGIAILTLNRPEALNALSPSLFVELQERWGAQGLQFVGVAIDEINKVKEFMDTYGVTYPMLTGVDDAIEISKLYGNRFGALPYTVIIDRHGNIARVQRGELERDIAEKTIKALL